MLTFTIAAILLATLAVAGWPLLTLRRARPVLQVTGGACCIAAGSTFMGLLAAGLIALPGAGAPQAFGQEPSGESAAAATESASSSDAAAEAKAETPAEPKAEAKAEPAPAAAVTVTTSETPIELETPAKPAEDIKIETLPDGTIQIPAGRPQWVKEAKSNLSGSIHTIYVTSDPYKLSRDAQRGLDEALKRATDEYIGDQLGSPLAAKFIPYSIEQIRDRFVKQTYHETINFESVGPMEQFHAQLAFDDSFRNELRQHWAGRIAESRLYQVGLGAGAALMLLASVFGYFRLDNATRGYYTGRLQFMTAAAILAIVALGAAAAFRFTWL
jgi:hypothetical protein